MQIPTLSGPRPDRTAFERDGFIVVRNLGIDVAATRLRLMELEAAEEIPREPWIYLEEAVSPRQINRVEHFADEDDALGRLARNTDLLSVASYLLGEQAILFKEKVNLKLPGGTGFELHQDQQAGWSRYAPYFLTALVAIDPADVENGCLELAAGLHKQGLIGTEWKPMSISDLNGVPLESVAMAPGDAVFFDSYVPHRSEPNRSTKARRALYITYNRASDGDLRARYYLDKWESFPPDIARLEGRHYAYKV